MSDTIKCGNLELVKKGGMSFYSATGPMGSNFAVLLIGDTWGWSIVWDNDNSMGTAAGVKRYSKVEDAAEAMFAFAQQWNLGRAVE